MKSRSVAEQSASLFIFVKYVKMCYFFRQSERQVMVYRTSDLQLVHNVVLDVSPAILVPFYDEDSNTLFLTSKVRN
jgi:coronin-7